MSTHTQSTSKFSFKVRLATTADLNAIIALSCSLCRETEGFEPDQEKVMRGIDRILKDTAWFALVAEDQNGQVIAEVIIGGHEWSDWSDGVFWWVTSLYVAPHARGHGLIGALFSELRKIARNSNDNVIGIRGGSKSNNTHAHAALAKIGRKPNGSIVIEERF